MTGIERVDPGFKLLAVAARMHGVADIVVPENGQACNGVADAIVGLTQGLLAKKTMEAETRAWKLISEISPILPSPILLPHAITQADRMRSSASRFV